MFRFTDVDIQKEEFICGNKFIKICDEFKNLGVHFSKIDFWREEIQIASNNNKKVFVTHQGDNPVTQEMVNSAPKNINVWFAANCRASSTKTCKVVPIPLGLNNVDFIVSESSRQGKYSSDFSNIAEFHKNIEIARNSPLIMQKNLVYSNFNVQTNFPIRNSCKKFFENKTFVTTASSKMSHLDYLVETLHYPFVLSPPGNGDDCVRIWETIYLGRIPIVLNIDSMQAFKDLPIMFVDSWSEVTEQKLKTFQNKMLLDFKQNKIELKKAKISFWKEQIRRAAT